jgi:hypothetical protein
MIEFAVFIVVFGLVAVVIQVVAANRKPVYEYNANEPANTHRIQANMTSN